MKNRNYKTLTATVAAFLWTVVTFGQSAGQQVQDPYFYDRFGANVLLVVAGVIVVTALLILYRLLGIMIKTQQVRIYQEQGLEEYLQEMETPSNWWKKFYQRWEGSVPLEQEEDILLDHNYDGIRELDNNLPPWWVAMFYITIIYAVGYLVYFHFTDMGMGSREEYATEMKEAAEQVAEFRSRQANLVNEGNVTLLSDETALAAGKTTFNTLCATCHGQLGEGGVGPNFADNYWIHGCNISDLFKTIKYGVPEKGMISWQSQLRPSEMQAVASYILTLQGTNPPNQKEPQGEECAPANGQQATSGDEKLGMK